MARLLIVDDSVTVRLALGRAVRELGHEHRMATTLQEAVDEVEAERPDLILLDVMTGDWGLMIRMHQQADPVPILLFSGRSESTLQIAGRDVGARRIVHKGAPLAVIQEAIEAALRERGARADSETDCEL